MSWLCILSSVAPQAEAIHDYCASHKKILIAPKSQKYYLFQLINGILTSEFMSLLLQSKRATPGSLKQALEVGAVTYMQRAARNTNAINSASSARQLPSAA